MSGRSSTHATTRRQAPACFAFILLLLFGCASTATAPPAAPPKAKPPAAELPPPPHIVPIINVKGATATAATHARLLRAYQRWPQAAGTISRIELAPTLTLRGLSLLGMFNHRTRVLSLALDQPGWSLLETLHHEIAHALWSGYMTSIDRAFWAERYERVRELKGPFPSAYAARSMGEFFAEHMAAQAVLPDWHRRTFPIEYLAMQDMGLLPRPLKSKRLAPQIGRKRLNLGGYSGAGG